MPSAGSIHKLEPFWNHLSMQLMSFHSELAGLGDPISAPKDKLTEWRQAVSDADQATATSRLLHDNTITADAASAVMAYDFEFPLWQGFENRFAGELTGMGATHCAASSLLLPAAAT